MPDASSNREVMVDLLRVLEQANRENLARYKPSPRQAEFHEAGKSHTERALVAANQSGKTFCAGFEFSTHLTGLYPDWWTGRRFKAPIHSWAAGITNETTRDNPQRILMGKTKSEWGTGALPKACIDFDSITMSRACSELIDTVRIKHVSGGYSHLGFNSYIRGREKFQGETLDLGWCDEEPPIDVYSEFMMRLNLGTALDKGESGSMMLTCTPLLGMSEVIEQFWPEPNSSSRFMVQMDLQDSGLYTSAQIDRIVESLPSHERDARARGIPMMGSGRCFPIDEEMIKEDPFDIPNDWPRIAGMDIGWDHPTAIVHMAFEPLHGKEVITHVYACYAQRETPVAVHAAAIKDRGEWVPVAWPSDALQHDKGSGLTMSENYRKNGVNMLREHATFLDGGHSVEAGVQGLFEDMKRGRFKVASHLHDWFHEFRMYHRAVPKGATVNRMPQIVKTHDDRLCATRYGWMMQRFARIDRPRVHFDLDNGLAEYDPFNPGDAVRGEMH